MSPCCRDWYLHNICSLLEKKKKVRDQIQPSNTGAHLWPLIVWLSVLLFSFIFIWADYDWCGHGFTVLLSGTKLKHLWYIRIYPLWGLCVHACICVCTDGVNLHVVGLLNVRSCVRLLIYCWYFHPVHNGITSKQRGTGILYLQSPKILNDFEYIASC